jgi:hypothetical protein
MTRILAAMQTWSVQSSDVLTACLTLLHDLAQVSAPPHPSYTRIYSCLIVHRATLPDGSSLVSRLWVTCSSCTPVMLSPRFRPKDPPPVCELCCMPSSSHPRIGLFQMPRHSLFRYCTLGKLVSFEENVSKFEAFLVPQKVRACVCALSRSHNPLFQAICDQLRAYLSTSPSAPDAASTDVITGLMRDLVGVCESCSTRRTYTAFFNWLHPDVLSMLPQVPSCCGWVLMHFDTHTCAVLDVVGRTPACVHRARDSEAAV